VDRNIIVICETIEWLNTTEIGMQQHIGLCNSLSDVAKDYSIDIFTVKLDRYWKSNAVNYDNHDALNGITTSSLLLTLCLKLVSFLHLHYNYNTVI